MTEQARGADLKGIIFDLGETLVYFSQAAPDPAGESARSLEDFMRGQGFDLNGQRLMSDYGTEMEALIQAGNESYYEYPASLAMLRALRRHIPSQEAARLAHPALQSSYESLIPYWRPYPDALETLSQLRDAGYRLGCISNNSNDRHGRMVIEYCGLRPWLSPVYTSAQVGLRKPHPGIFGGILEDWRLPPQAVVMVGDLLQADVAGAHNAGLRCGIWINRSGGDVGHQTAHSATDGTSIVPEGTIKQLSQLPDLLSRFDNDI